MRKVEAGQLGATSRPPKDVLDELGDGYPGYNTTYNPCRIIWELTNATSGVAP